MIKQTKPFKEMTDRELMEFNIRIQHENEKHLSSIKGWVQFLGWATIISFIIGMISLYAAGIIK